MSQQESTGRKISAADERAVAPKEPKRLSEDRTSDAGLSKVVDATVNDQEDGSLRLRALAPLLIFDVLGPLGVYFAARVEGASTIVALVVSGVLPALRVTTIVVQHRRLDAIGALVLSGIVLGTVVGLASGSARLYLLDGLVPTIVLGLACLVSLMSERPVMFRVALEMMGEDSPRGRAFAGLLRYPSFRHTFQVITAVWGMVFLTESAMQAVVVETCSINTAKLTSNLLPIAVVIATFTWTRAYGQRAQQSKRNVTTESK